MENNRFENSIPSQEKGEIKFEIAKPEDWQKFKNLRLKVFESEDASKFGVTKENFEERMIEERAMGEKEWFQDLTGKNFGVLARHGSKVVGMGLVERRSETDAWFFYSGYVQKEYRKQRIGQKIFATRLREIKRRGGGRVVMAVEATNKESIELAQKFGFEKGESYGKGIGFFMELENTNNPVTVNKINEVLDEG